MEWKTVKLGEVCDLIAGFAFKAGDFGDYPSKVVKIKDIAPSMDNTGLDGVDMSKYNSSKLDKFVLQRGDFVAAMTGSLGKIGRYLGTEKVYINQRVLKFVPKDSVDWNFIYYSISTWEFYQYVLNHIDSQSVQPNISATTIGKYEFPLPPLETQRRIATILSSLDDKIENNNRINRNLEAQAQALFKSWFVDFEPWDGIMPEDWKFDDISNIPHILETGRRPKGGAVESGIPSIGAEHIKGMGTYDFSKTKYISEEYARSLKTGKVNGYELLIYKDGGKPGYFIPNFTIYGEGYPFGECYLNEHVLKLDFPSKAYNIFCYFYFQTPEVMNYLNAQGGKAAIPGINKSDIDNINILTPDNEAVVQFGDIVLPYFKTILRNLAENSRLAALRDTLLPKLMKGEITL